MNEALTIIVAIVTSIPTTLATLWVTNIYISRQASKKQLLLRIDLFTNCPSFSYTVGDPSYVRINPFWLTPNEDGLLEHPSYPGGLLIMWKDGKKGNDHVLLDTGFQDIAKAFHQWMEFEVLTRDGQLVLLFNKLDKCSPEEHFLFQPRPQSRKALP